MGHQASAFGVPEKLTQGALSEMPPHLRAVGCVGVLCGCLGSCEAGTDDLPWLDG